MQMHTFCDWMNATQMDCSKGNLDYSLKQLGNEAKEYPEVSETACSMTSEKSTFNSNWVYECVYSKLDFLRVATSIREIDG